jgi:hypothetical protein
MSYRAYAARRRVSIASVHRAVRSGRLNRSVAWSNGVPHIIDAELADREWPASAPDVGTSLRAYARHRNVSAAAVCRAVRRGRLSQSVTWRDGRPSIRCVETADLEWSRSTTRKGVIS